MLNRTLPPVSPPLESFSLPTYEKTSLSNGIPIYYIPYGDLPLVSIKAIYHTGSSYQESTGIAGFTTKMMMEGTQSFSSIALAHKLDETGAWLYPEVDDEFISVNLSTVSEQLEEALPLMASVMLEPTFPEEEFQKLIAREMARLKVESSKTRFQARKAFGKLLFGENHPYASFLDQEELVEVSLNKLKAFYASQLGKSKFSLLVVGKVHIEEVKALLEKTFGGLSDLIANQGTSKAKGAAVNPTYGRHHVHVDGLQATIRLGHLAFERAHEDFHPMQIVNTALGGYFGSRLMKSIREEKGYTYGIYSSWSSYKYQGAFFIQSDIGKEYINDAIDTVKHEIKLLAEKGISSEELDLIRNYLLGTSINRRETPFQIADILKYSIAYDLSFEEMDRKFKVLEKITPDEIASYASKYFQPDNWLEVIAGPEF
ncbi:MAG: pitrilysin family protein [Bacteroidota bacterium]